MMTKTNTKFGLASKITVLIVALVALIMGVVSYFSIYQEEQLKHQEMDKRMTDTANMIAGLKLIEPLAGQRVSWAIFKEFVKVVRNLDPNILYISIVDNNDEVKAFMVNPNTAADISEDLEGLDESQDALMKLVDYKFIPGTTAKIIGEIIVSDKKVATINLRFSLRDLKREIMLAKIRNILLTFVMMGIGFGGAVWLAKSVTRPIGDLTVAMAAVAKGDLNVTAEAKSNDEIGALTKSFNLMVQDLKEKVRIKDAFDVVADELKEVEKIKEAFESYVCREAQERFVDTSALSMKESGGNRHPVAIVFADLSQVAQISSTQEAASFSDALVQYFKKFVSTLFEYEGQVYKFNENVFMVVFGLETVHDDDERRAILTAVQMQKALAQINKSRIARNEQAIFVSTGVATGESVGGIISEKGLAPVEVIRDYLGFTMKMSNQPFSVVMVTGDIYRRVTNLVRGEKVEDLQMPNTGENLEVYRITGTKF